VYGIEKQREKLVHPNLNFTKDLVFLIAFGITAAMICSKDEIPAFFGWSCGLLVWATGWNLLNIFIFRRIDPDHKWENWLPWLLLNIVQFVLFYVIGFRLDSTIGLGSPLIVSWPYWLVLTASFALFIVDLWIVLMNIEKITSGRI
jgi:hypothetical protein